MKTKDRKRRKEKERIFFFLLKSLELKRRDYATPNLLNLFKQIFGMNLTVNLAQVKSKISTYLKDYKED